MFPECYCNKAASKHKILSYSFFLYYDSDSDLIKTKMLTKQNKI